MSFCGRHFESCWVISIISFLSAILNWNFRLRTSNFKSPRGAFALLNIYLLVKWDRIQSAQTHIDLSLC